MLADTQAGLGEDPTQPEVLEVDDLQVDVTQRQASIVSGLNLRLTAGRIMGLVGE